MNPVTIVGGTYNDPATAADPPGKLLPIIRVRNTSDVTIEDVVLIGQNPGGFHRHMVAEAGLDILSSDHVNIIDVAIKNTFGDGMTLFSQFGIDKNPVTNLYVNGLSIDGAGRQGITLGYVENATIDNVELHSAADVGWDFESDLNNVGSGNVTVNDARSSKGIRFIESLQGPITFNDCQCSRNIHMLGQAATSGQLVTFNGGSYEMQRNTATGDQVAGIVIAGPGRIAMNHVGVTRSPGIDAPKGPAESVTNGGLLTLVGVSLPSPFGNMVGVEMMP